LLPLSCLCAILAVSFLELRFDDLRFKQETKVGFNVPELAPVIEWPAPIRAGISFH
jgi:hypothetical protein